MVLQTDDHLIPITNVVYMKFGVYYSVLKHRFASRGPYEYSIDNTNQLSIDNSPDERSCSFHEEIIERWNYDPRCLLDDR